MIDSDGVWLCLLMLQPWLWAVLARTTRLEGFAFHGGGFLVQAILLASLASRLLDHTPAVWLFDALPGVGLRADGMALLFCTLTLLIGVAATVHVRQYFLLDPGTRHRIWPLLWTLLGGLHLIWLARDFLLIYLGMEIVALCVVTLIALDGSADALRAALGYLQAVLLGTLAVLLGTGMLVLATGSFSVVLAGEAGGSRPLVTAATVLIVGGLTYRAALFPLHTWLPPAHGNGYAPVSAVLSALVTKASFYILARFWLDNTDAGNYAVANFLGVLGAFAVVWGGWMALRQTQLKMLVAYSSVNQVGYLFLLFPLIAGAATAPDNLEEVTRLARDGALLQVISHAFAKAALFMAAGNLVLMTGSGLITRLGGISRQMPLALISFGLAGVSIMGLPPSGGFLAKWYLMQASLLAGQWWWAGVLLVGGLLSAAYLFRIFRISFLENPREDEKKYHLAEHAAAPGRQALSLNIAPLLLALMAAGLGLAAIWPLELLGMDGGR